jgi:hypothetical protein
MGNARMALYSEIKPRLSDFLTVSDGGSVSNIAKDLLNRAQQRLWGDGDWRGLIKNAALTVDPITFLASAPADFGRALSLFWDTNNDGIAEGFFDLGGGNNEADFAEIRETFDKATGYDTKIYFGRVPSYTPILKYMATLPDFEETDSQGNALVEYSFFPAELLIRCAQVINLEEHGSRGNEFQACMNAYVQQFVQFRQQDKKGFSQLRQMKDSQGQPVYTRAVYPDGSDTQGSSSSRRDNDERWVGS